MTLEVEVFPVNYTTQRFVQYSDETCMPTQVPGSAVCHPLHDGRVPKLIDCNFGPLTETPTNESFYSLGSGSRTTFNFNPAVNLSTVILHHYCATTNTSQLPSVQIQKGVAGSNGFNNILVSVRGEESNDGDYLRITCEHAGQRGNTTLTIVPESGSNSNPFFSSLQLVANVGMGTFELSEVQFFTKVNSNPGMHAIIVTVIVN